MSESNIKILVCYYKDIYLISNNTAYLNIQCGKESTNLDLKIQGDDVGDNISSKNRYWSEITGLYWAWKNMERTDYVGLCSYRRFFSFRPGTFAPVRIMSKKQCAKAIQIDLPTVAKLLTQYDVILPEPYVYAYSIRRVCSMNYVDSDFELLEQVVYDVSPEYKSAYRQVFYESNKMIGHNMFILPWDRFQEFCNWVFTILFRLEKIINPSHYPVHQVRVFGYMHEILLSVFIEHHKLRAYHSQINWICDTKNNFKFNNPLYRLTANAYYYTMRALSGTNYRHVLSKSSNGQS